MAGVLPEGLVSNKRGVSVAMEDVKLQVEDTLKLWRIYSSGHAAIAENVGRRLENFFFRISMSERIRGHLSGADIDKQFDSISQGGYIRTTPTPSPRSSRSIGSSYDTKARPITSTKGAVSSSPAKPGPVHGEEQLGNTSFLPVPQNPSKMSPEATTSLKENKKTPTARPPPILKKLSSGSKTPSRSSLVLSPSSQGLSSLGASKDEVVTFDPDPTPSESFVPITGKSARKSTTTRFNEEVAVSIPKVPVASRLSGGRSSGESSQRGRRKSPITVASSGTSKRRPSIMRQRSSQASSSGASKDPPLRSSSSPNLARSMKLNHANIGQSPSQEAEASSSRRSRAASPHLSKHRRLSSTSAPSSEEDTEDLSGDDTGSQEPSTNTLVEEIANANAEQSKSLVDPDFRSRFEDKKRPPTRSFTNISSFARKSSAVVPTAASFEASGMLDTGQGTLTAAGGRDTFNNEIVPLKAPASAGPGPSIEASQPLPRTKSQLTLLLDREKNRSAG